MPRVVNRYSIVLAVLMLGLLLCVTAPARANVVVNSNNTVTFTLTGATTTPSVLYSSKSDVTVPMSLISPGVWSVTVGPVDPEWYRYHFIVDGQLVADPVNAFEYFSQNGRVWSFFMVHGADTDFMETKNVPHGIWSTVNYFSSVTKTWRTMLVYTPPGYETETDRKYPVLYFHHGAGNTGGEPLIVDRANFILDNLIAAHKAVPMILVAPTHQDPLLPTNSDSDLDIYVKQELIGNIVPTIEKQFRVLPGSENRAIAGLSMGGGRTFQALVQVPKYFDYYCPLSMAVFDAATIEQSHPGLLQAVAAAKNIKLIWVSIGTLDPLVTTTQAVLALFAKYGIKYIYNPFPNGLHEENVWRHNLNDFAPSLFREHDEGRGWW